MEKINKRPLILISNDDGYRADGINALIDMLRDIADIIVCAPTGPRSGMSCAFSATNYLRLSEIHREEGLTIYSCTGTPIDCVKIALDRLCPRRPDMVIGGINHGDNASVNTHYSGTMSVALEGCMKYIPSVAFSICDYTPHPDFSPLVEYVREIVIDVLRNGLKEGVCLNVNFPLAPQFNGVRVCRMAPGTWGNEIAQCHHPRGYDYYWMVGEYTPDAPDDETNDNWALRHNYVAITPTRIDVTAYEEMDELTQRFVCDNGVV